MAAKTSSHADLVRPSRDGDQFHYAWAARRTLAMLLRASEVVAVTIEGGAAGEDEEVEAGHDVIDVAEYRGSSDLASARHLRTTEAFDPPRQQPVAGERP